jgi:hypothetical protein
MQNGSSRETRRLKVSVHSHYCSQQRAAATAPTIPIEQLRCPLSCRTLFRCDDDITKPGAGPVNTATALHEFPQNPEGVPVGDIPK